MCMCRVECCCTIIISTVNYKYMSLFRICASTSSAWNSTELVFACIPIILIIVVCVCARFRCASLMCVYVFVRIVSCVCCAHIVVYDIRPFPYVTLRTYQSGVWANLKVVGVVLYYLWPFSNLRLWTECVSVKNNNDNYMFEHAEINVGHLEDDLQNDPQMTPEMTPKMRPAGICICSSWINQATSEQVENKMKQSSNK